MLGEDLGRDNKIKIRKQFFQKGDRLRLINTQKYTVI